MKRPIDEFSGKVIKLIQTIPRGRVATYGQIAELAGYPSRARHVAYVLRVFGKQESLRWQRVIGAQGRIAFPKRNKNHKIQRTLLEKEGVIFDGVRADMARCQWKKRPLSKDGRKLPRMFSSW